MNPIFDAHCHLQDKRIAADSAAIIARAHAKGVIKMMCCGTCENDWDAVKALSAQEGVLASFGLHPWYVSERTDWWLDKLETLLAASPGAGVGEIGLDHAMDKFTHGLQEEIFLYQLRLANRLNRPVSLHCRRAFERVITLLEKEGGVGSGGVLHSFSGPKELIPVLEKLGLFISFSGSITSEGNRRGVEAIRAVSADRLLIETDSPDMLPAQIIEGPNEPANCAFVNEKVALLFGERPENIAKRTWDNACGLFERTAA
jgi:TatD DNase family protein